MCLDAASDHASRPNNSTNPYGTLTLSSQAPYLKVPIFRYTLIPLFPLLFLTTWWSRTILVLALEPIKRFENFHNIRYFIQILSKRPKFFFFFFSMLMTLFSGRGTQGITRTQTQQRVISLGPNHRRLGRTTIWMDGIWWSILSTLHHHRSPRMLNTGHALCLSMPRENEGCTCVFLLVEWKLNLWYIVLQCTQKIRWSVESISSCLLRTEQKTNSVMVLDYYY